MRLFLAKPLLLKKLRISAQKGILRCSCDATRRAALATGLGSLIAGTSGGVRGPHGAHHEIVEVGGPAEGHADALAGQHVLVGLVAAEFPLLAPRRQRRHDALKEPENST